MEVLSLTDVFDVTVAVGPRYPHFKLRGVPVGPMAIPRCAQTQADATVYSFDMWRGGRTLDCIDNDQGVLMVSERVRDLFSKCQFKGWSDSPVKLFDKTGAEVKGNFFRLAINDYAGELDWEKSAADWKTWSGGTRTPWGFRQIYFDTSHWNGDDFFMLKKFGLAILVTRRVVEALNKIKAKGFKFVEAKDFRSGV